MKRLGPVLFYWLVLTLRINGKLLYCRDSAWLLLTFAFLTATFLVSNERPCPMERVTFTCTAPGAIIGWSISDVTSNIVVDSDIDGLNMARILQDYTVTLTAVNDSSITSTISRIAENRVTVTCEVATTNVIIGSATIQLTGEIYSIAH